MPDPTSNWQKLSALSGVLAAILVPLALGFAGNELSKAVKEREVQAHFVELAVGILREPPRGGEADSIRSWATGILSKYSGVEMTRAAQQALQHTSPLPDGRADRAAALEHRGFDQLLGGNLDSAVNNFRAAEAAYPTFHQVYEIAKYLDLQRAAFRTDPGRRQVLAHVKDSFPYGMPPDVKEQLSAAARP